VWGTEGTVDGLVHFLSGKRDYAALFFILFAAIFTGSPSMSLGTNNTALLFDSLGTHRHGRSSAPFSMRLFVLFYVMPTRTAIWDWFKGTSC
jgi:hypothetical protein